MEILELIRRRRSVRTFGAPLTAEDIGRVAAFAETAGNPYGLPVAWKILGAKEYGLSSPVIAGTDCWIAGKMARAEHAEEAFGFSFEKIVLYVESLGGGTTWMAGTMDRPAFEKAVELAEGEVMPCVSPLGYPAERMSLKESLMRKGVRADSRLPFGELFFSGGFGTPLPEQEAGRLKDALEAVRLAPSAVNRQPWRLVLDGGRVHFYEKHSRGYVSADGWDTQKIDMGIALCHFEAAAKEGGASLSFSVEDPGIPVPADTEYTATYTVAYGE